jgi:hypothetical protein
LNVHGINDVRQAEMHASEPLVLKPRSFEVETTIEKLKRYKSPGIDQILAEQIEAGGSILCYEIHKLNNSIWNKEELPYQWKESIIVPMYKKDNKADYNNYRRILLLLTMYIQNFIQYTCSRLTPYVDKIIGYNECGFQCNISAANQIFCIHQILKKKWEYNGTVHVLFVDFEKAYD